MAVHKHETGGFRAYKKILGIEHQLYSFDEAKANEMQKKLDTRSNVAKALKAPTLISSCGRLVGLRIRQYKKTNRPTFQLQFSVNGKQKKTEYLYKSTFESMWTVFFKLWRKHCNLSMIDIIDNKKQINNAKRLYMQDVYNIENNMNS